MASAAKRKRADTPNSSDGRQLPASEGTPSTNSASIRSTDFTPSSSGTPGAADGLKTGKFKVSFRRADGSQIWQGPIKSSQSLAELSVKVAKKLQFPQGTDIRLAHVRDGAREVDIWDRYDLDTLRQRAVDRPDIQLSINVYEVAGPSSGFKPFRTPLPSSLPDIPTSLPLPPVPGPVVDLVKIITPSAAATTSAATLPAVVMPTSSTTIPEPKAAAPISAKQKGKQKASDVGQVESPRRVDVPVDGGEEACLSPSAMRRKMKKDRRRQRGQPSTAGAAEGVVTPETHIPPTKHTSNSPSMSPAMSTNQANAVAGPSKPSPSAIASGPKSRRVSQAAPIASPAPVPAADQSDGTQPKSAPKGKRKRSITPLQQQSESQPGLGSDTPSSPTSPKKKRRKGDKSASPQTTGSTPSPSAPPAQESNTPTLARGPGAAIRKLSYKPSKPSPLGLSTISATNPALAALSVDPTPVEAVAESTADEAPTATIIAEVPTKAVSAVVKPKRASRRSKQTSGSATPEPSKAADGVTPSSSASSPAPTPGPSAQPVTSKARSSDARAQSSPPADTGKPDPKKSAQSVVSLMAKFRQTQAQSKKDAETTSATSTAPEASSSTTLEEPAPVAVVVPIPAEAAPSAKKAKKQLTGRKSDTATPEPIANTTTAVVPDDPAPAPSDVLVPAKAVRAVKGSKKGDKQKKDEAPVITEEASAAPEPAVTSDTGISTESAPEPIAHDSNILVPDSGPASPVTAAVPIPAAPAPKTTSEAKPAKAPKPKAAPKAKKSAAAPAAPAVRPPCLICGSKQAHTQAVCHLVEAGIPALEERLEVVMREMSGGRYWAQGVEAIKTWIERLRQAQRELEEEEGSSSSGSGTTDSSDDDEEEEEEEEEMERLEQVKQIKPTKMGVSTAEPSAAQGKKLNGVGKEGNDSVVQPSAGIIQDDSSLVSDASILEPQPALVVETEPNGASEPAAAPISEPAEPELTTETAAPIGALAPTIPETAAPIAVADAADIAAPTPAQTPAPKPSATRKTPITYSRPNSTRRARAPSTSSASSAASRETSPGASPLDDETENDVGPAKAAATEPDTPSTDVPLPIFLRGLQKKRRSGSVDAVSASTALIETEEDSDSASDSDSDSETSSDADEDEEEGSDIGAETDAEAEAEAEVEAEDGEGDEDGDVSMGGDEEAAFNAGTPVKPLTAKQTQLEEDVDVDMAGDGDDDDDDASSETTEQAIARLDLSNFHPPTPAPAVGLQTEADNADIASDVSSADTTSSSDSAPRPTKQTPAQRRVPPARSPATVSYDSLPDPQALFDQFFSRPLSQAERAKVRKEAEAMGDVSLRQDEDGEGDEDEDVDEESNEQVPAAVQGDDASSIGDFSVADKEDDEMVPEQIEGESLEDGQKDGGVPPVVESTQPAEDIDDAASDTTNMPIAGQALVPSGSEAASASEEVEEESGPSEEIEVEVPGSVNPTESVEAATSASQSADAIIPPSSLPAQSTASPAMKHTTLVPSQTASTRSVGSTASRRSARFGLLDEQAGPSQNVGESEGAIAFTEARAEEATPEPESQVLTPTQSKAGAKGSSKAVPRLGRGRPASQVVPASQEQATEATSATPTAKPSKAPKRPVASSSQQSEESLGTRRRSGRVSSSQANYVEPTMSDLEESEDGSEVDVPAPSQSKIKAKGKATPKRRTSSQTSIPASQASQPQQPPSLGVLVEESDEVPPPGVAPPAPASSSQIEQLDSSLPNGDTLPPLTQRRLARAPPSPATSMRSTRMAGAQSAQSQSSQPSQVPESQVQPLFMPQSQYPETQAYTLHHQSVQYSSPRDEAETPKQKEKGTKGRKAAASPIIEESDQEPDEANQTPTSKSKPGEALTNGDREVTPGQTTAAVKETPQAAEEEEEQEYVSEVDEDVSPPTASASAPNGSEAGNGDEDGDDAAEPEADAAEGDKEGDSAIAALLSISSRKSRLPPSSSLPLSKQHPENIPSSFPSLSSLSRDYLRSGVTAVRETFGFGTSASQPVAGKTGGKLVVTPGGEEGSESDSESDDESDSASESDSDNEKLPGRNNGGRGRGVGLRGRYVSATRTKKVVKTKGKNVGW